MNTTITTSIILLLLWGIFGAWALSITSREYLEKSSKTNLMLYALVIGPSGWIVLFGAVIWTMLDLLLKIVKWCFKCK